MRVYHFMPAKYALENIANRRLKIARIDDLNDPFEHLSASLADDDLQRAMLNTKAQMSERFGFLCFCRGWSNPIMWSHYAESHRGMCFGFDFEYELTPITYRDKRIKIPRSQYAEEFLLTTDDFLRIVYTKFKGWAYEQELRVSVHLNDAERGLYFKEFDGDMKLRDVILGVRCATTEDEIERLVSVIDNPVAVMRATLARETFEMVRSQP